MKPFYLLYLLSFTYSLSINGQTNCDDANYYLVSAYSHVKDAYDSRNISHLKYYANRSIEAIRLSKKALIKCDCDTALKLANDAAELLIKVEDTETWEDGRFYVNRARNISKQSVIEIDKCSVNTNNDSSKTFTDSVNTSNNNELDNLKNEQLKLKQQQDDLKQKEEEIKRKLALQKEKQLQLEKETLVLSFKSAITKQIKTYNETLNASGCKYKSITPIRSFEDKPDIKDLKKHYLNYLKALALNYTNQLNACTP